MNKQTRKFLKSIQFNKHESFGYDYNAVISNREEMDKLFSYLASKEDEYSITNEIGDFEWKRLNIQEPTFILIDVFSEEGHRPFIQAFTLPMALESLSQDIKNKKQELDKLLTERKNIENYMIKTIASEEEESEYILKCPKCGSSNINQFRCLDGPIWCEDCGYRVENKEKKNPFFKSKE